MPKIELQKAVPVPAANRGRKSVYPFHEMEIGDSFEIRGNSAELYVRLNSAAVRYRSTHAPETKFALRRFENAVRVWRVK